MDAIECGVIQGRTDMTVSSEEIIKKYNEKGALPNPSNGEDFDGGAPSARWLTRNFNKTDPGSDKAETAKAKSLADPFAMVADPAATAAFATCCTARA